MSSANSSPNVRNNYKVVADTELRKSNRRQLDEETLFNSTGFRYSAACKRGFPHPWCARRHGRKGWIVRDCPTGAQFVGWKAARRALKSRNILMERMKNKIEIMEENIDNSQSHRGTIADLPNQKWASNQPGLSHFENPRADMDLNCAVVRWFKNTNRIVEDRTLKRKHEEFQDLLRHVMDSNSSTRKRSERTASCYQAKNEKIFSKQPTAKHKAANKVRHNHEDGLINHVETELVLGEDPEMDDMIEDIVRNYTADGGVHFEGSAIMALKEAASAHLANVNQIETKKLAEEDVDAIVELIIEDMSNESTLEFDSNAVIIPKEK